MIPSSPIKSFTVRDSITGEIILQVRVTKTGPKARVTKILEGRLRVEITTEDDQVAEIIP